MEDEGIDKQTQIQILTDILDGISKTEILKKYSISSDEYSEIKENLLKQIKEKADEVEITSYAVRYFRNLAKERNFSSKAKELGLSVPQTKLLNQIILGKTRPTYGIIFLLRRSISPASWIYMESEKLPAPVDFKPIIEEKFPAYDFPARKELAKQKTLGHLFFDIIRERQVLTRFCAIHNCPLMEAANFIYMKKKSERRNSVYTPPNRSVHHEIQGSHPPGLLVCLSRRSVRTDHERYAPVCGRMDFKAERLLKHFHHSKTLLSDEFPAVFAV